MHSPSQTKAPMIGGLTTFTGTAHAYLRGVQLKLVARLRPDDEADGECRHLTTAEELVDAGGVSPTDRTEVGPLIEVGRRSFVTTDARDVDLVAAAPAQ